MVAGKAVFHQQAISPTHIISLIPQGQHLADLAQLEMDVLMDCIDSKMQMECLTAPPFSSQPATYN